MVTSLRKMTYELLGNPKDVGNENPKTPIPHLGQGPIREFPTFYFSLPVSLRRDAEQA